MRISDWSSDVCSSDLEAGHAIRSLFLDSEVPPALADAIQAAYDELKTRAGAPNLAVAVRSSATAEDLPDASFAGQQETRSEERRVGKGCVSTWRLRWSRYL